MIVVISIVGVVLVGGVIYVWARNAETEGGRLPPLRDMAVEFLSDLSISSQPFWASLRDDPQAGIRLIAMRDLLVDRTKAFEAPIKTRGADGKLRAKMLRDQAAALISIRADNVAGISYNVAIENQLIGLFFQWRADQLERAYHGL